MSKLILAGLCAITALGMAGCKGAEENNMAIENLEDLNATGDMNMGMENMDMNMGMNATENAAESTETTGGATGNEAVDNATGNSY
jgi:hypothetical protein